MATNHSPPARRGPLDRLLLPAAGLVLLAGLAGSLWLKNATLAQSGADPPALASVVSGGVGALGRLEPGWKVFQVAPASTADGARVDSLLVEEGDVVQPGAVLATLDTAARRQAGLAEARAQVAVARAKVAQVKAGAKPEEVAAQEALIGKHRAALQHARSVHQRARRLAATRATTPEDLDQREADLASNLALLHQAEKTLAAMKAVRPEDVAAAEAEVARAEAGVALAEADLDASKIRAPIAGRVLKISARPGERVGEAGLAEVGDTDSMHAVAEVYERDAPRVRIGQRARVKVQSLPGELGGEVVRVGWKVGRRVVLDNDPVKDTDGRVVEVRVKLDSASGARVAALSYARVEVHIDAPPIKED